MHTRHIPGLFAAVLLTASMVAGDPDLPARDNSDSRYADAMYNFAIDAPNLGHGTTAVVPKMASRPM